MNEWLQQVKGRSLIYLEALMLIVYVSTILKQGACGAVIGAGAAPLCHVSDKRFSFDRAFFYLILVYRFIYAHVHLPLFQVASAPTLPLALFGDLPTKATWPHCCSWPIHTSTGTVWSKIGSEARRSITTPSRWVMASTSQKSNRTAFMEKNLPCVWKQQYT
jgi:hypothetical protein